MTSTESLQERFAPENTCFGCGPANPQGLRIRMRLRAKPVQLAEDRAVIEGSLESGGKKCATCIGTFVAVKPGHPAYHRW